MHGGSCSNFTFVHIPKTGGSSVLYALGNRLEKGSRPSDKQHLLRSLDLNLTDNENYHDTARFQFKNCLARACNWEAAVTFAVVRNPFDLIVSTFFWSAEKFEETDRISGHTRRRFRSDRSQSIWNIAPRVTALSQKGSDHTKSIRELSTLFNRWLVGEDQRTRHHGIFLDFTAFARGMKRDGSIHSSQVSQLAWVTDPRGKVIVSRIIKFESIDLQIVTSTAGLVPMLCNQSNVSADALPSFRVNPSRHGPSSLYYDAATCEIIRRRFSQDFRQFGYNPNPCHR